MSNWSTETSLSNPQEIMHFHINTISSVTIFCFAISLHPFQEKRYQSLEHQRQLQELTFVREEKRQLGSELEALRSKDRQLRDRIGQLEAILRKVVLNYAYSSHYITSK